VASDGMLEGVHAQLVTGPVPGPSGLSMSHLDEILAAIDDYPIDRLSVGDHAGNNLETYTGLGYLAARTNRVAIGPYVTNPVTRDPGIHAAALATLDALTGGRAYWVAGRGDGVLRNLGLEAASVDGLRGAVEVIRALLTDQHATLDGRAMRLRWPDPAGARVPLCVAASGPRMLEAAGQVADGVYVASGVLADDVDESRQRVEDAARAVGRPAPELWWVTRFGIGDSFEEAFAMVRESLSSIGNHSLRGTDFDARRIPRELQGPLLEYHDRYDWSRKNVSGPGPSNADLVDELGLRDYLLDRFAIVGTPAMLVDRLRELADSGCDARRGEGRPGRGPPCPGTRGPSLRPCPR
jgi:5,10-methylenetetrahydromethanopterin reductase